VAETVAWQISGPGGGFKGILLCAAIDPVPYSAFASIEEVADRATFAQLYRKGKLRAGSAFPIESQDLVWVLSTTLLHEMFHVVFDDDSQYRPFTTLFKLICLCCSAWGKCGH
jgi:hypothetical protein